MKRILMPALALMMIASALMLPTVPSAKASQEGDYVVYSLTDMGITVISNAFGLASNGTHLIGHSSPVYHNPTTPYYFIRMSDMVVTGTIYGPDRYDTPHPGQPGNTRDLAFGGGYLWATFSGTWDSIVWKLDPVSLGILDMFQTPRWTGAMDSASPTGLAHDGECIWLSEIKWGDERQIIYRINPSTRAVVDQFDFPYGYSVEKVHGLAFGNGYLWVAGSYNIYKYDIASETFVGSFPNPANNNYYEPGFANLDFDGTYLWAADDHNLYRIYTLQPEDFALFTSPGSRTIKPGWSTTFLVNVASISGFSSEVSFTSIRIRAVLYPTSTGYITVTPRPPSVTPPPDGSAMSTLVVYTEEDIAPNVYEITVTASSQGIAHEASVNLTVAKYELFIEVDYFEGHKPNTSVLEYIRGYYMKEGSISVTFNVSPTHVDLLAPNHDIQITLDDFWEYEAVYNDGDDRYNKPGNGKGVYQDKDKWVLYVNECYLLPSGQEINGFCDLPGFSDGTGEEPGKSDQGGNYILIADGSNDDYAWEQRALGITEADVETVILMHELGHSVGILLYPKKPPYGEVYDPDHTSVMWKLSPSNCLARPHHYSSDYWKLRDVGEYKIKKD